MRQRLTFGMGRRQAALLYGLLVATFGLYLCGIWLNGWANPYYAAAVQAGTQDWRAFFFGSFDGANAITIDKTPLSLWLMGLSARAFGFNIFAIVLPNVLAGVASVAILFGLLRNRFGYTAAWLGAFTLAVTPVAVAVFRFNDPDALLTCLMLAAVAVTFRLNRTEHARWALVLGLLLGAGFMTKMLQAFLILPALAIPYLLFGQPRLAKRFLHLLISTVSLVLAGGWWLLAVSLTPASMRPYIGGTQTNNILELVIGYNGLGRLNGNVGNTNGSETGITLLQPSITRLFGTDVGGHIAWFIPLALVAGVVGLILFWRNRQERTLFFETLVWLAALVITALTFSFMQGIFHQYYTVALAPYIAALTATGVYLARHNWGVRWVRRTTLVMVAVTGLLAANLLSRAVGQELTTGIVVIATATAVILLATLGRRHERVRLTIALTGIALFAGQVVYGYYTITTPQLASIPVAGPTVVFPFTTGGALTQPTQLQIRDLPARETRTGDATAAYAIIKRGTTGTTWAAATSNGLPAAAIQLAVRQPVLELGGYNARDPFPTLAQFKRDVGEHKIGYYVLEGLPKLAADTQLTQAQRIQIWVREHYAPVVIGTTRLYDLRQPAQ